MRIILQGAGFQILIGSHGFEAFFFSTVYAKSAFSTRLEKMAPHPFPIFVYFVTILGNYST